MKDWFIPGEEWFYVKLYTGPKSADTIINELILPVSNTAIKELVADSWFFIRYSDPEHHIRWRIHLNKKKNFNALFAMLIKEVQAWVNNGHIWNIQADTYKREVNRYGEYGIGPSEKLFFNDSEMVADALGELCREASGEQTMLFACKSLDRLLNDFRLDINEKKDLLYRLNVSFSKEFGKNAQLASQISTKFRLLKKPLISLLANENKSTVMPKRITDLIEARTKKNKQQISGLLPNFKDQTAIFAGFLSSHLHMNMNRIFRSDQRFYELLIYDIMFRYYKSKLRKIPE